MEDERAREEDFCGRIFSSNRRQPFAFPGAEPRYAPDRPIDVRHVRIEVTLDFERREISGAVTTEFAAIADPVRRVTFDAEEMDILSVSDGRRRLSHDAFGGKLTIDLGRPLPAGRTARTIVRYRARPPLGLYFVGRDPENPKRALQAWTQGQDDDSRFWFPCVDDPNEKAVTEVLVTVPEPFRALSNGRLVSERRNARRRTRTFHYRQEIPHPAYLVMIAAGPFEVIRKSWRGIPVEYWVEPGREREAMRSLGKTPRMLSFFSREIGVPYPYEKYAQVCVRDFIFGGMENTTATVLTDRTLHDRRAHLDFSSDGLVAHELAHQWFGDLITCRDWSQGWLNEGFATYYGSLYEIHDLTPREGPETGGRIFWELQEDYFNEDRTRYRRPIVANEYDEPMQLFDAHLYKKGALVLHMLERLLGRIAFRRGVREYVRRFGRGSAVTADLQKVLEETSGRSLQEFFEQWVYKPGHPELSVSWAWDDPRRTAALTVRQKQDTGDGTPVFRFDLPVEFVCGGETLRRSVRIVRAEETFYFPLPSRPTRVRVDPDHDILRSLEFRKPLEMLTAQLREDPRFSGRVEAVEALARDASPEAIEALGRALRRDSFWAIRARAARALGTIRGERARALLLQRLRSEEHPKARRGIVAALGSFRGDETLVRRLVPVLGGDPSYFVCAEAAHSVGRIRAPGSLGILRDALEIPSWQDTILCGVVRGIGALLDPAGIDLLLPLTAPDRSQKVRQTAAAALASIARLLPRDHRRTRVRETLEELLLDPNIFVVSAAAEALAALGDPEAAAPVRRTWESHRNGMVRTRVRRSLRRLEEGAGREEALRTLRDDLDRLDRENRTLRDRLSKLEKAVETRLAPAPRPRRGRAARGRKRS